MPCARSLPSKQVSERHWICALFPESHSKCSSVFRKGVKSLIGNLFLLFSLCPNLVLRFFFLCILVLLYCGQSIFNLGLKIGFVPFCLRVSVL